MSEQMNKRREGDAVSPLLIEMKLFQVCLFLHLFINERMGSSNSFCWKKKKAWGTNRGLLYQMHIKNILSLRKLMLQKCFNKCNYFKKSTNIYCILIEQSSFCTGYVRSKLKSFALFNNKSYFFLFDVFFNVSDMGNMPQFTYITCHPSFTFCALLHVCHVK